MKQVDKLIENLEQRYGIPIEEFIELYDFGYSIETMANSFKTTQWTIRAIASALNLRLGKKFRKHDLLMFYARRGEDASAQLIEEVQSLQESLDQVSHDLLIKDKALIREQARLRSYRRMEKELAFYENVKDIIEYIVTQNVDAKFPPISTEVIGIVDHPSTQFMMLSDLHAESLVTINEIGGDEGYAWDVMIHRLQKVFIETQHAKQPSDTKLHIYLLGDLISGIIHDSLEATSKHPIEAIAILSELLTEYIVDIAKHYTAVSIFAVSGNHERLTQEIKSANKGFDFGYLLYKLLEAKLSNQETINIDISTTGLIAAEVAPKVYCGLHHGDHFRGNTGDINRMLRIKEAFKQQGYTVTHLLQGHTHSPKITAMPTNGIEIVNGSLIGANQYSHTRGFVGIPWSQTIGRWNSKGKVEDIRLIGD